jgi:hypothetical protein
MKAGSWAVIGAGPCGISTVAKLIDCGARVTWFDPSFRCGRMGSLYRHVPSNTTNGDFVDGLRACKSFRFDADQDARRSRGRSSMADLPRSQCFPLGVFVESLEDATAALKDQAEISEGVVSRLHFNAASSSWDVYARDASREEDAQRVYGPFDAVVLCTGASPIQPGEPVEGAQVHDVDRMVCPRYAAEMLSSAPPRAEETWVVVGNSHSGVLVVKNLVEGGAKRVICVQKRPLRFMTQMPEGHLRYGCMMHRSSHCCCCGLCTCPPLLCSACMIPD